MTSAWLKDDIMISASRVLPTCDPLYVESRVEEASIPLTGSEQTENERSSDSEYDGQIEIAAKPVMAQRDDWMNSQLPSSRKVLTGEKTTM